MMTAKEYVEDKVKSYPRNTYIVYNNDGERVYQRW